jgi:hypothetical protein
MTMKPIVVGMINPYSDNPEHALVPYPERSAGHRLWRMLHQLELPAGPQSLRAGSDKNSYMHAFDRRNLFLNRVPTTAAMRRVIAKGMVSTFPRGSTVILLGADVLECFATVLSAPLKKILIHPQVIDGITWRWLPHPSGRSTTYNDPVMRMLAGTLLADVLDHDSTAQENSTCQRAE